MAFHNYKTCLLLILSLFLILGAGPSNGFTDPGFSCIGQCTTPSNCNQECIKNNFPKGGYCIGNSVGAPLKCCCRSK
ncbi:putative knottin, scorpion toxin [Lupinus albus]|uniref:Putative knottin, scorpion toxin n=1 Tax=Lupinus albus TaxID=3870 RepID=A0A6A4Q2X2_LUPAL|nr:putative knottin, scorpion toxin [Lupinus albus]